MKTKNSMSQKIVILWKVQCCRLKVSHSYKLKNTWKGFLSLQMVFQSGSVGFTIMGMTIDLKVVQNLIDTLHKEAKA